MIKTITTLCAAAVFATLSFGAQAKNSTKFQADMMTIARGDDKPVVAPAATDVTGAVTQNRFNGAVAKPCIVAAANACK